MGGYFCEPSAEFSGFCDLTTVSLTESMATTAPAPLDSASILGLLGARLIAEQATRIFEQGRDAVVSALLTQARQLAEKEAGPPTGVDPAAPSGQTPP